MLHHGLRRTSACTTRLGLAWSTGPPSISVPFHRHASSANADSSTISPADDIAVLGGGITGLATAYYLSKELPRRKVTIYEASDRLGGWLSSTRVPVKNGNILFEAGPRTIRPSGNGVLTKKLVQDLDLAKDAIFTQKTSPAASSRFLYYPDHLVCMPHPTHGLANILWAMMNEPVFEKSLTGFLSEIFRNPRDPSIEDESVASFFTRRLSQTMVDRMMSAVLHGIYAGDVYQLSAKSLFPLQWRAEVTAGGLARGMLKQSLNGKEIPKHQGDFMLQLQDMPRLEARLSEVFKENSVFTFKDGLSMLPEQMVRHLAQSGNVEFQTSTPIHSIALAEDQRSVGLKTSASSPARNFSQVISALPPAHLNPLHTTSSANLIPPIQTVTVMTVSLFYRTPNLNPPGFGYLIPRATPFENNPERALGVIFDNAYSPGPEALNPQNWAIQTAEQLQQVLASNQTVSVDDFAWYNIPDRPNAQDELTQAGTKLTVMLGGHWWDDWPAFPDEQEGLALAKSLLARHLNVHEEPEVYQVRLQRDCIPQYTVGHEKRLMTAHNNLWNGYKGLLRVAGNWINGVGVNDAIRSAWDVVQGLKAGKSGTGLEHVGSTEHVIVKKQENGTLQVRPSS